MHDYHENKEISFMLEENIMSNTDQKKKKRSKKNIMSNTSFNIIHPVGSEPGGHLVRVCNSLSLMENFQST